MSRNNRRRNRRLHYVKIIKNIFLISIIGGVFLYQIAWFTSLDNFSVSYELESYENSFSKTKNFGEYIDSMFRFMKEHPINISKTGDYIVEKNSTLIQELGEQINETITKAEQIYTAFLNENITKSNITEFLDRIWNNVSTFIPSEYLNPAKIKLFNGGMAIIHSISFTGNVVINNDSARFLENLNNVLLPYEDLILQITLKELILTIIEFGIDFLIDLTIEILENTTQVFDTTITYLNEFAQRFELYVDFDVYGIFGLLPMSFTYSVNLLSIFNNLNLQDILP